MNMTGDFWETGERGFQVLGNFVAKIARRTTRLLEEELTGLRLVANRI